MIAAEVAVRAWCNALPIVGDGNPLSRGAYLASQRSPADGAYAVLSRIQTNLGDLVAEPHPDLSAARISFSVFAGTQEAAEAAAAALAGQVEELTAGPCGDTGIRVLGAAYLVGPALQPAAGTSEQFCFVLSSDFILCRDPS